MRMLDQAYFSRNRFTRIYANGGTDDMTKVLYEEGFSFIPYRKNVQLVVYWVAQGIRFFDLATCARDSGCKFQKPNSQQPLV